MAPNDTNQEFVFFWFDWLASAIRHIILLTPFNKTLRYEAAKHDQGPSGRCRLRNPKDLLEGADPQNLGIFPMAGTHKLQGCSRRCRPTHLEDDSWTCRPANAQNLARCRLANPEDLPEGVDPQTQRTFPKVQTYRSWGLSWICRPAHPENLPEGVDLKSLRTFLHMQTSKP